GVGGPPPAPAEIYELPSGTRWTRASGDSLPGLVAPTDVSYGSFDGLEIPCLHYRADTAPKPTVVLFHGGPEGQSRGEFNLSIALLKAAGFYLVSPNLPRSTRLCPPFFSPARQGAG